MLDADRDAVHAQLGERAVMLRHLELKLYSAGLKAISLQAAMLAGVTLLAFLFMAFIRASTANEDRWFVLHVCVLCTFGLALLALLIATFSLLHGPGLALRGNVTASGRAVRMMRRARHSALQLLLAALAGLVAAIVALAWLSLVILWQKVLVVATLACASLSTVSTLRATFRAFGVTTKQFSEANAATSSLLDGAAPGRSATASTAPSAHDD